VRTPGFRMLCDCQRSRVTLIRLTDLKHRILRVCYRMTVGFWRSSSHKIKLHLFDLLWICSTTSFTANPQQIHNSPQQIHNKSNEGVWAVCLQQVVEQIHNKSTTFDKSCNLIVVLQIHTKSTKNRTSRVWTIPKQQSARVTPRKEFVAADSCKRESDLLHDRSMVGLHFESVLQLSVIPVSS
jgi:hypothetical protein